MNCPVANKKSITSLYVLLSFGVVMATPGCRQAQSPEDSRVTQAGMVVLAGPLPSHRRNGGASTAIRAGDSFPLLGQLVFSAGASGQFAWMENLNRYDASCSAVRGALEVDLSNRAAIAERCTVTMETIPLDSFPPEEERRVLLVAAGADDTWQPPSPDRPEAKCVDYALIQIPDIIERYEGITRAQKARRIAEQVWRRLGVMGKHEAALTVAQMCPLPAAKTLASRGTKAMTQTALQTFLRGCGIIEKLAECQAGGAQ